jgi:hypothetical protein
VEIVTHHAPTNPAFYAVHPTIAAACQTGDSPVSNMFRALRENGGMADAPDLGNAPHPALSVANGTIGTIPSLFRASACQITPVPPVPTNGSAKAAPKLAVCNDPENHFRRDPGRFGAGQLCTLLAPGPAVTSLERTGERKCSFHKDIRLGVSERTNAVGTVFISSRTANSICTTQLGL